MGKAAKHGAFSRGAEAYRKVLGQAGTGKSGADEDPPDSGDPENDFFAPEDGQFAIRTTREPKIRRVAKFLALIGKDEAARILAELDIAQVEAISKEIVNIRKIDRAEAEEIFAEFREMFSTAYGWTGTVKGGVEEARKMLYVAFGREKGDAYLRKVLPFGGENPFEFLERFSGGQIALLLRTESLSTATLIISRLPPKLAAETLKTMLPGEKTAVVKRLAYLDKGSPEAVERAAEAMREKARLFDGAGIEAEHEIDGPGALAAILKEADISFGEHLLKEMRGGDPELAEDIQERLYSLDDVVGAEDRALQDKLRSMDDRDIALLLKGRSVSFTEKILSNVSEARRQAVEEEGLWLGPVARRDADTEGRKFLDWFRKAREKGEIIMYNDGDVVR